MVIFDCSKSTSENFGATVHRAVRVIVQRAREQGSPICSEWENRGGYYFPADEHKARSYLRQQRARIKSANAALNGVIKYLQSFAVPEDTQYD